MRTGFNIVAAVLIEGLAADRRHRQDMEAAQAQQEALDEQVYQLKLANYWNQVRRWEERWGQRWEDFVRSLPEAQRPQLPEAVPPPIPSTYRVY